MERIQAHVEPGPIFVHSEEQIFYDTDSSWLISEETGGIDPSGRGAAYVTSRRRMGVLDVSPQFYRGDLICKEAWESHNDKLCVQRQIAAQERSVVRAAAYLHLLLLSAASRRGDLNLRYALRAL